MCIEEDFLTTLIVRGMCQADMAIKLSVGTDTISKLVKGEASLYSLITRKAIKFNFQVLDILFPDKEVIKYDVKNSEHHYIGAIAAAEKYKQSQNHKDQEECWSQFRAAFYYFMSWRYKYNEDNCTVNVQVEHLDHAAYLLNTINTLPYVEKYSALVSFGIKQNLLGLQMLRDVVSGDVTRHSKSVKGYQEFFNQIHNNLLENKDKKIGNELIIKRTLLLYATYALTELYLQANLLNEIEPLIRSALNALGKKTYDPALRRLIKINLWRHNRVILQALWGEPLAA